MGKKYVVRSDEKISHAVRRFVLTELAVEKFSWYSRIYKEIDENVYEKKNSRLQKRRIYPPVVSDALKKLIQRGDILKEEERRKIGGKGQPVKPIHITLRGLLKILAEKETWDFIEEIADKQSHKLPIVFGNWEYFRKNKVRNRVIKAMKAFFASPPVYSAEFLSEVKGEIRERLLAEYDSSSAALLTEYVLFLPLYQASDRDEALDWVRLWMKKPDLKRYMIQEFRRKKQNTSEINYFLKYIEKIQKSEPNLKPNRSA